MKVRELLERLKNLPESDLDLDVTVAIRQYNKRYPVAYEPVQELIVGVHGQFRLVTSLPDGVFTASKTNKDYFTV